MPRINLLPWREEARKERQKQFLVQLAGGAVLGGLMVFYGQMTVGGWIDNQEHRNDRLESEIRELDQKIAEIQDLQDTRDRLLARMRIIEELQTSRPDGVRLFDELVWTLPSGVYLTSLEQSGNNLEIRGVAESSARVSAYLRNIEDAEWLGDPDLGVVERVGGRNAESIQEFTIRARQRTPGSEDD